MTPTGPHIVVAGAGSIGCFAGGLLTAAGRRVTLLARPRIVAEISAHDLSLTDYTGMSRVVPARLLTLCEAPDCLKTADLVLVTVKSGATADMAALIARYAPQTAPVVSLQNGADNINVLKAALPGRDLRAGMVPFNVVPVAPGHYHRATSGDILIGTGPTALAGELSAPDFAVSETADITAVQWGKFLINLNNALNALSGLTLQDQLMQRDWRRLMADQMVEALAVLRAARIPVISTAPVPARLIPHILRLPTPLFRRVAAQMLTIDPTARASMAYDLMQNRPTEIDALQGRIIALGQETGLPTPLCQRIAGLIRTAEARGQGCPKLDVNAIRMT